MQFMATELLDSSDDEELQYFEEDHRNLPRNERKVYDHEHAQAGLERDYLRNEPLPLFDGKEFDTMFRISKARFQRLMEDIGAAQIPFYLNTVDAAGKQGTSFEARLLLPLKTMAYGVGYHMLRDHFQMSQTQARQCCIIFDQTIRQLYEKEYLRLPTKADIKSINRLHEVVHGFPGLFGSLDCMHTKWKNCPMAWQGSYKGKEKKPSIVLEAISDYHMWFWHAAYGYAGTLNDKSILDMSPWFSSVMDGSFSDLESEVVPFHIGSEKFQQMYVLIDGIYPSYSRFVQGIKCPIGPAQKKFTAWQESARKDIERAFGCLQAKWQCVARPMHQINLENIGARMTCCLILHNMCVSDRVMDDVYAVYDPAASVIFDDLQIEYPDDILTAQGPNHISDKSTTGISNAFTADAITTLTRKERWTLISDEAEFTRLHRALSKEISKQSRSIH